MERSCEPGPQTNKAHNDRYRAARPWPLVALGQGAGYRQAEQATAGQPSGSRWGSPQGSREKHPEDPSGSLQDCCWHGESSRLAEGVPVRPWAGTTVSAHVLGEGTTKAGRVPILSGGLTNTHGGREGERAWRALRWKSQQGGAQWDPRRAPALATLWVPRPVLSSGLRPLTRGWGTLGRSWTQAETWDGCFSLCAHTHPGNLQGCPVHARCTQACQLPGPAWSPLCPSHLREMHLPKEKSQAGSPARLFCVGAALGAQPWYVRWSE